MSTVTPGKLSKNLDIPEEHGDGMQAKAKVPKYLFCSSQTNVYFVEETDHTVEYLKVYTKHLYDIDYMQIIHSNYLKFLNRWEEKAKWCLGELEANNFWKKESFDVVTTFFEDGGLFQTAKRELVDYKGPIVIHALCDKAFLNALKISNPLVASIFRWAGLCSSMRMYVCPQLETKTFEIYAEFGDVEGEDLVWKFDKL